MAFEKESKAEPAHDCPALDVSSPPPGHAIHSSSAPPNATTNEALLLIATWYCMSTALSMYNKEVVGKKYGLMGEPFPAPLLMSAVQFIGQYGLAVAGHALGVKRTLDPANPRSWQTYNRTVLPNGVATGLDIGFSNAALSFISLSFYTMCKSSAPLFLLMCAFLWRIETPTWGLAGIVGTISIGLLMIVEGEVGDFNLLGFTLVMSAACMSGVRWTITQILLQGKDGPGGHSVSRGTAMEVLEAVTPVMAATAGILSILCEPLLAIFATSVYFSSFTNVLITLGIIGVGALFAFFMVMVEFVLISRTSALTFMVAGVFKEILTVVVAHFAYGDEFTTLNGIGLAVLICGVAMFNYWKYQKQVAEDAASGGSGGGGGGKAERASGDDSHDDRELLLSGSHGFSSDAVASSSTDTQESMIELQTGGHGSPTAALRAGRAHNEGRPLQVAGTARQASS